MKKNKTNHQRQLQHHHQIKNNHSELDLSGNRLASLPPSLSQLTRVRVLHLAQNPFYDFQKILAVLQSMASLDTLSIDVEGDNQEEKEDLLILGLPRLKFFNGLSLIDTDEGPSNQLVTAAPAAPFSAPAAALSTSLPPSLLPSPSQIAAAAAIPLEDQAASDQQPAQPTTTSTTSSSSTQALEEADLENAALLFGAVKDLMGKLAPTDDAALSQAFDDHVKTVMQTLKMKLNGVSDPFIQRGEILMAKHELYEVCFAEVINVASASSPKFGAVLRKLRDIHADLFSEFPATLHEMRPHYLQRLSDMKSQVVRAERESSLLLEAAEVLENEAIQHQQEREQMVFLSNSSSNSSSSNSNSGGGRIVQQQAQQIQQTHHTPQTQLAANSYRKQPPPPQQQYSSSSSAAMISSQKRPIPTSFANAMSGPLPAEATPGGGAFGPSSGPPRASRSGQGSGSKHQTKPQRVLSLKQLKEQFISLIYDSKMKFDRKCKDAHLPRETMEMHMYTFLNQRYGLKSLIVEHASAIIQAVNKYSTIDNDVLVFGKIIRNEIDEEFRFVQKQLKETVVELLRVKLKGTFHLKTDAQIARMVISRCRGYVEPEEWKDIIRYMYNHEDGLAIMVLVEDCIHYQPSIVSPLNMPGADTRGRRRVSVAGEQMIAEIAVGGGRVPFEDFLKILLGKNKRVVLNSQYIRPYCKDLCPLWVKTDTLHFIFCCIFRLSTGGAWKIFI